MKFIPTYESFLDFVYDKDKIQWLKLDPLEIQFDSYHVKYLTKLAVESLYDIYFFTDNIRYVTVNRKLYPDRPTLKYGFNKDVKDFIDNLPESFNREDIYNVNTDAVKISGNKKVWHKIMGQFPFIPKTVYKKSDAKDLNFPVIGKPASGHSGLGIKVFKTIEELNASKLPLDLYSEAIDFAQEYRALCVKNEPVVIMERVINQEKNKTIFTKKADEQVSFVYIEQNMDTFSHLNEIKHIIPLFRQLIPLDVFSLDFFIDKNNKLWIIESNAATGLGALTLSKLYVGMYKDFHKKDPPNNKMLVVNKIVEEYGEEVKKVYPKEYALSINPV